MLRQISRFLSKNRPPPIQITTKALEEVARIKKLSKRPYMLFSAKGGGCGGFEYSFEPTYEIDSKDIEVENNKVTIHVDYLSEMLLLGTLIDFKEADFNKGVLHNKFTFTPQKNIATTCGCGVSFSPNFDINKKK